jgi:hypothetical protein
MKDEKLNRRTFNKQIGLSALIPFVLRPGNSFTVPRESKQDPKPLATQNEITGRKLTEDEIKLLNNFLLDYNKSMASLHARDLNHDLLPAFIPILPKKKSERKKGEL